jgi:hypothetical protein
MRTFENSVKRKFTEAWQGGVRRTPDSKWNAWVTDERERGADRQMAESQVSELQNGAPKRSRAPRGSGGLWRNLAYHRRARLEAKLGEALDEVDRQIQDLRAYRG